MRSPTESLAVLVAKLTFPVTTVYVAVLVAVGVGNPSIRITYRGTRDNIIETRCLTLTGWKDLGPTPVVFFLREGSPLPPYKPRG